MPLGDKHIVLVARVILLGTALILLIEVDDGHLGHSLLQLSPDQKKQG